MDSKSMHQLNKVKNRLKMLRKKAKLTLDDVEEQTGIKRGTFSNYENGKTEPNIGTWQQLADFFDVSLSYISGNSNENDAFENSRYNPVVKNITAAEATAILCSLLPTQNTRELVIKMVREHNGNEVILTIDDEVNDWYLHLKDSVNNFDEEILNLGSELNDTRTKNEIIGDESKTKIPGQKMKEYRLSHGLSQKQLAKQLGISRPYMSEIESNKRSMSIKTINNFTDKLGITLSDFFN